jgi:hypothetical protein
MKEVMQGPSKENPEGVHYGTIPGCKKPSLYKAGAEKLSMTFRLRPIIEDATDVFIEQLPGDHISVRVYCHILNAEGLELATGIGSCSSMESKYRYRGGERKGTGEPVPNKYWNLYKSGKKKEAQKLIGGEGFGAAKIDGKWQICEIGEKAENPDISDVHNTVLKIAKKRAYIDGILSATGASDIFTQDIEEPSIKKAVGAEETPISEPEPLQKEEDKKPGEGKVKMALPAQLKSISRAARHKVIDATEEDIDDTLKGRELTFKQANDLLKSIPKIDPKIDIGEWIKKISAICEKNKKGGK